MGIWRRWIFPSLRLIVFAVIAVALVKLAFFADDSPETAPLIPTGEATDPIVTVATGKIVNDVEFAATVTADPAVEVKASLDGDILELDVEVGQEVDAGARLAVIRKEIPQDPVTETDDEGNETVVERDPLYRTDDVVAPVDGIISSLAVLEDQDVVVGDLIATVAPPTFSVTGTIAPQEQYRLQTQPTEAEVAVVGGPESFTCTDLTISVPLAGADQHAAPPVDPTNGGTTGGGPTVTCAVPSDVTVFAGLTATVTIAAGAVEDALQLPVTAVKGNAETGTVWVVGDTGEPVPTPVTLGLNDGTMVQILDGVSADAQILEFVPIEDPTDPEPGAGLEDNCFEEPDGSIMCEAVSG